MKLNDLGALFDPEGIAVVGASNNPLKAGCVIMQNMAHGAMADRLYPVTGSEPSIAGLRAYKLLSEIPHKVELVVLIMPSSAIFAVMDDLDKRMSERGDVKVIVCAAADYAETKTEEGARRQARLMQAKEQYGIRIVGPNCIGVINNQNGVNTTFVITGVSEDRFGPQSRISMISQSGSIAATILMEGASKPLGIRYNKFISIGNMADVNFIDLLEYLENDPTTQVIGIYLEGFPNGRKLIETMARIAKKKPILVLKVGRSSRGGAAASSHTGSLAGADAVYDAAFRQYGIVRVENIGELLDSLAAFDRMPRLCGTNMFVLTQAGGPGIFCTDEMSRYPIFTTPLVSDETKAALRAAIPPMSSVCEPEGYADITAAATVRQHCDALHCVLMDDAVDCVQFITVVPPFLPVEELGQALAEMYKSLAECHQKPVFFCIMAGEYVLICRRQLEKAGLCTYDSPLESVAAAKNCAHYYHMQQRKEAE